MGICTRYLPFLLALNKTSREYCQKYLWIKNFICYFDVSMDMKHVFLLGALLLSAFLMGQDKPMTADKIRKISNLASKYHHTGEYQKAAKMYKKLYINNTRSDNYLMSYLESLLNGKEYEKVLSEVNKEIKKRPHASQLYVYYARACDALGRDDEEEAYYMKAIDKLGKNGQAIMQTAQAFVKSSNMELAIKTYQKGNEIFNQPNYFAYQLAELYRMTGQTEAMIDHYLRTLSSKKGSYYLQRLFTLFQTHLSKEEILSVRKAVYAKLQDENPDPQYYEMLEWTFLHLKEYKKALRQARSTDRRMNANGAKVMKMGRIAFNDKDYETAQDAFQYILKTYGTSSQYYLSASNGLISILKTQILDKPGQKDEALVDSLLHSYEKVFQNRGKNRETAKMMVDYANALALIKNDTKEAKYVLQEVIDLGDVKKEVKASAKIDLADYLLIDGDRWESTLLYSQVDKELQEAELGETARYRNAMLSYYNGDFEWAQEQFDVLKRSTSRLISNDAIDMSVFIQDNLGLDTTAIPLEYFSESDLLIFQNKHAEAFEKLDSIEMLYPEHGLLDDILYRKANMHKQMGNYDEAVQAYTTVIEKYKDEIKADNSLFELAQLYEEVLDKKEEAKKLYEKLFLDYTMSTLTVEARKRFRALRKEI